MFVEAGQLAEPAAAEGAAVRPLAGVRAQMDRQVALLREAVAAVHAGERLLARVAAHVPHQRRPPAEALAADGAAEWPLARVDPHVDAEVPSQGEGLPADAAAEQRLSVDFQVKLQAFCGLQLLPAHAAASQMGCRVGEQDTHLVKGITTNFAAEHKRKLSFLLRRLTGSL